MFSNNGSACFYTNNTLINSTFINSTLINNTFLNYTLMNCTVNSTSNIGETIPFTASTTQLVMYVMFSIIFATGVSGNMFILIVLIRRKQKFKNYDVYIASMTVADLMSSIFVPMVMIQDLISNLSDWYLLGIFGCKVFVPMNHLTMLVSALMMVLIAFSRLSVFFRKTLTPRSCKSALWKVLLVWFISVCCVSPYCSVLIIDEYGCIDAWSSKLHGFAYFASHEILVCVIPIILLPIIYSISILKLRSMKIPGENRTSFFRRKQQNKSIMIMFGSITIIFFILTTPYMVSVGVVGYFAVFKYEMYEAHEQFYNNLLEALYTLSAFNVCVNPFIYTYLHKDMKRKMAKSVARFTTVWKKSTLSGNSATTSTDSRKISFATVVTKVQAQNNGENIRRLNETIT